MVVSECQAVVGVVLIGVFARVLTAIDKIAGFAVVIKLYFLLALVRAENYRWLLPAKVKLFPLSQIFRQVGERLIHHISFVRFLSGLYEQSAVRNFVVFQLCRDN